MNLKILFIENIPWLQRVWWLQVVDSRGMTLTQRKLQEKILNSQNFFTNFLNSQNSWNSLLAIETLEPLQTSLLPTSTLGGSIWVLFIAKTLGYQEGFMPLMSSRCMQEVNLLSSSSFGHMGNESSCFLLLRTEHYSLFFFFLLDKHKETIVQIYRCTKDFWNLLSRLTHRSSVKDKLRVYVWIIW